MAIISAEEQARLDSLAAIVAKMWAQGGPAVRDALRYVANQMLSDEHSFPYEEVPGVTPDIESVYHHLSDLPLTGMTRIVRNPDLISSLEDLMNKNEREIFGSAVRNSAYTMFKLLPQNETSVFCHPGKGATSRTQPRQVAERLHRGLSYMLSVHGLDAYIKKADNQIRSYGHTRLASLVIAVAVKGERSVATRIVPLWCMDNHTTEVGTIELDQDIPNDKPSTSVEVETDIQVWPKFEAKQLRDILLKHGNYIESKLRGMDREELDDTYEAFVDAYLNNTHDEGDEDEDDEWDEEEDEDEEDAFCTEIPSRLALPVELPIVNLERPKLDIRPGMRLKTKKPRQSHIQNILIDPVWHAVDPQDENNIHYFSVSIVARDTVGHKAISASPLEALTISNVLMQIAETNT
ncbi:hypothetical protein pEaSNUABM46_00298 [Erwinia phage pEa_SNUABM_46]|nr:hypothetical protein pEaSNUABM45_00298 [Erwinia phage pEa_SNUABM_45]QYW04282.1 hypothetical protein pEaSNUABM46_00298 [Erwinia phage pEa_SNUABM_46]